MSCKEEDIPLCVQVQPPHVRLWYRVDCILRMYKSFFFLSTLSDYDFFPSNQPAKSPIPTETRWEIKILLGECCTKKPKKKKEEEEARNWHYYLHSVYNLGILDHVLRDVFLITLVVRLDLAWTWAQMRLKTCNFWLFAFIVGLLTTLFGLTWWLDQEDGMQMWAEWENWTTIYCVAIIFMVALIFHYSCLYPRPRLDWL